MRDDGVNGKIILINERLHNTLQFLGEGQRIKEGVHSCELYSTNNRGQRDTLLFLMFIPCEGGCQ